MEKSHSMGHEKELKGNVVEVMYNSIVILLIE